MFLLTLKVWSVDMAVEVIWLKELLYSVFLKLGTH